MLPLLNPGMVISLAQMTKPANWGVVMAFNYTDLVEKFLHLLKERNVQFVVVGGIALLQHVRGRNTEDIDLIIASSDLDLIPQLQIKDLTDMFACGDYSGLRVNVLLAEHPLFSSVARHMSGLMDYKMGKLPTATVDGLVVLKLFALPSLYRQFDFDRIAIYEADITQLLSRTRQEDSYFLDIVAAHISDSDHHELVDILSDIRSRLNRMKKNA
jgi:hypothetical protein